jgi:thiosulfate dehydrogenase [quinone] large subunit
VAEPAAGPVRVSVLYLMMWSVVLPPESNPVVDDHIIGALVPVALALVHAGDTAGRGRWWKRQPVVRRNRWLI